MNREEALDHLVKYSTKFGTIVSVNDWVFKTPKFYPPMYYHTLHNPITIDDCNRAKIVSNTKVRILSREHSEYVQKLAFEAGFTWLANYKEAYPLSNKIILVFTKDNSLVTHHFESVSVEDFDEIFIELPAKNELPETEKNFRCTPIPDINVRVLAENFGVPILPNFRCAQVEIKGEADQYDELRDSHLELILENMALKKENEAMAQRIKDIHRAINDAKVVLDV